MISIETLQQVSINVSVADTFAYMSNLENLANWSSLILTARKTSSEAIQLGTMLQSTVRFIGHRSAITFEVIEYEPNHSLTLKSTTGVAPCLIYYRFEPSCDGGTDFTQEVVLSVIEHRSELAIPVFKKALQRTLDCDLLMLKDVLEAKASSTKIAT